MPLSLKPSMLPVLVVLLLLPSLAAAQQSNAPVPVPLGAAFVTTGPSAFSSYQTFVDEPVVNWKSANDTVGRIGGWRAYAKEAAAVATKPSAQPGPVAKP